MIHGGAGPNHIYGGTGLDDIYGGSGTNFIYGHGVHDLLVGGSGANFIRPNNGSLGSLQVHDHADGPTFDGGIDAGGNAAESDYQALDPGYGGEWTFDDVNSGVRLGGATPVAVYANWRPDGTDLTTPGGYTGTHWSQDAVYRVFDDAGLLPNGTVTVNQEDPPNQDSPVPNDRPWTLLGVWMVPAGDTVTVEVYDGDSSAGSVVCMGDVMIHAIWPMLSIRADLDGTGQFGEKDDFLASCYPPEIPLEGDAPRLAMKVCASIEQLYYDVEGSTSSDWQALLPNISGLLFWASAGSTNPITPIAGDIFDEAFLTSVTENVWVSVDPSGSLASGSSVTVPLVGDVAGPDDDLEDVVPCMVNLSTTPRQVSPQRSFDVTMVSHNFSAEDQQIINNKYTSGFGFRVIYHRPIAPPVPGPGRLVLVLVDRDPDPNGKIAEFDAGLADMRSSHSTLPAYPGPSGTTTNGDAWLIDRPVNRTLGGYAPKPHLHTIQIAAVWKTMGPNPTDYVLGSITFKFWDEFGKAKIVIPNKDPAVEALDTIVEPNRSRKSIDCISAEKVGDKDVWMDALPRWNSNWTELTPWP